MSRAEPELPSVDFTLVLTADLIDELSRRYDGLLVVAIRAAEGGTGGSVYITILTSKIENPANVMAAASKLLRQNKGRDIEKDDL